MIRDNGLAKGELRIRLYDSAGQLKDSETVQNLIVTVGKNWMAGRFRDNANIPPAMSHMAIGSGSTAPAVGDTVLVTELGRAALSTITNSANTTTYTATFPPGTGTGAIVEAGIFNAASAGTMLNRATFAVKNKAAGDTMTIDWQVQQN